MPRGLNQLRGVGSARASAAGTSCVTLKQLSLPSANLGERLKREPARGAATDKKASVTVVVTAHGFFEPAWASGWLECLRTLQASQGMPVKRTSLSSTCMEWGKDGSLEGRCDQ